ncbi:hypothetical protein MTO96_016678 [Rhipicephalus appendiculatus]
MVLPVAPRGGGDTSRSSEQNGSPRPNFDEWPLCGSGRGSRQCRAHNGVRLVQPIWPVFMWRSPGVGLMDAFVLPPPRYQQAISVSAAPSCPAPAKDCRRSVPEQNRRRSHTRNPRFRLRGFLPTFVRRTAHPDTPGPAQPALAWCPVIASGSGDRGSAGRRGADRRPPRVVSRDPPRSRRVSLDGHAGLPERASINASRSVCVTGTRAGGDQRAITLRWARPALAGAANEPRNWRSTRYGSPREPIAACNHRWLRRRATAYELLRVLRGLAAVSAGPR